MEQVKKVEKVDYDIIHDFYCDDCGKYLGSSTEHDDGYYNEFGEFELNFFIPSSKLNNLGWFKVKKCFCDECVESFKLKLIHELQKLGFE